MPTSDHSQISLIVDIITRVQPRKVLDIGVGFGKYGALAREYLELWNGREKYNDWKRIIDGIEVCKEYLTPLHAYIYDHVFVGRALQILKSMGSETYDLILMIDVLEHLHYPEGQEVIRQCKRIAEKVLISTPIDSRTESHRSFGQNPYDQHLTQWKRKDLVSLGAKICFRAHGKWVAILSEEKLPELKYLRTKEFVSFLGFSDFFFKLWRWWKDGKLK